MNKAHTLITSSLVSEDARLDFLPNFFGPRRMMRGESLVYDWLGTLSKDYRGGYWNFYKLSNGGFYMAPERSDKLRLIVEGNWFDDELSPDAAGIVATLFALSQLANEFQDERLIDLFYLLREYVAEGHPEGGLIFQAID